MPIKYHKITKVEKAICTAEQKIAYNYASTYADRYRDTWKKSADKYCEFQKSDFVREAIEWCMKMLRTNAEIQRKYDIDGIFCALNAGMRNYFEAPYGIMTSYEEIGKTFPALYLNE